MTIVFLSKDYPPHLIGGVGVYVQEISRLLARLGHAVHVITVGEEMALDYIDGGVQVHRIIAARIRTGTYFRNLLPGFLERLEYSLAVSQKLEELRRRIPIDIVESSEARAEAFWFYVFRRRPPLVIKLHTPETVAFQLDHTPVTADYRFIKRLEEFWIRCARVRVGISQDVVEVTRKHFKLPLGEVPLIPNPIDLELFRPTPCVDRPPQDPEILYVGRLEFRKGVHVLIRAFARVQQRFPLARLVCIGGECGMKAYLMRKQQELTDPDRVVFIDQVSREQLVSYYQRSSVCVIPSLWENYPYVCLEAMACAKPVVASAIGGLKTMIRDNETGLLVSPGSPQELAGALTRLLGDVLLQKRLGAAARVHLQEHFAPEKIARQALEVYASLVKKKT